MQVTLKHQFSEYLIAILIFILPAAYFVLSNDGFAGMLRSGAPDGQSLYLLSRLSGIAAIMLLFWQLHIVVVEKITGKPAASGAGSKYHKVVGISLFLLVVLHAGFFVGAASLRSEELSLQLLIPAPGKGYYALALTFGVISLYIFAGIRYY